MRKPRAGIPLTEKQFRDQVIQLAKTLGWRVSFAWTSIHSPRGLPDLTMVRACRGANPRIVYAELKTDDEKRSKTSPEQDAWLADLAAVGKVTAYAVDGEAVQDNPVQVYLWRPRDFDEITRVLR